MKRRLQLILVLLLIAILSVIAFRKPLFYGVVSYEPIRTRNRVSYARPTVFVPFDVALARSLRETASILDFTFEKTSSKPSVTRKTGRAHCVGYANLTAEIFAGLNDEWTAETTVGYIRVLGMNVHEYVHHPFFKNHDFVVFTNKTTGDRFAVDSSLYDYTGISEVRLANE